MTAPAAGPREANPQELPGWTRAWASTPVVDVVPDRAGEGSVSLVKRPATQDVVIDEPATALTSTARRPARRPRHSRRRVLAGAMGIAALAVAVVGGVQLLRPSSPTMALAGDSSAMASTPPTAPTSGSAGDSSAVAVPAGPTDEAAPATAPAPMVSATYTVLPGDTLSAIAAWFKLHGYNDLYQANKAAIGADPNLIYPGQTITLSAAGVTMGR